MSLDARRIECIREYRIIGFHGPDITMCTEGPRDAALIQIVHR